MTCKQAITEYLANKPFTAGGTIGIEIYMVYKYKPETVGRCCRKMAELNQLERTEEKGYVEYKLPTLSSPHRPAVEKVKTEMSTLPFAEPSGGLRVGGFRYH